MDSNELKSDGRPSGIVTFLFTDIEGSTRLWENYPDEMKKSFQKQETILREGISKFSGYAYKMIGDAFQVSFSNPVQALQAAVYIQRRLSSETWGYALIRVRMAIHACMTEERGDDYVGPELNRIARVLAIGYGGQILLTQATVDLLANQKISGIDYLDLGFHQLRDIRRKEHLYQVIASGLPSNFPPLKSIEASYRTLRVPSTPFIGREREIIELKRLIVDGKEDVRLVTLVGPGGIGKTRLAMKVAADMLSFFSDGVYFIDLATINVEAEIIPKIAENIKLDLHNDVTYTFLHENYKNQLFNYLSGKKMLLILDNFEQLVGFAGVILEMVEVCHPLKLIITSRERLNIPGENVYELDGLTYPVGDDIQSFTQYSAVKLFISCAQKTGIMEITEADLIELGRICRTIQGMPLGIELAASWSRILPFNEIAKNIEQNLDFLSTNSRGIPDRHRTIRAVFEHSWNSLSQVEKASFSCLSVFMGGFSLAAANEVSGANLHCLSTFLDKSLLRRLPTGRFAIHEILKQYASEKLAENVELYNTTRKKHAQYYVQWLSEKWEKLKCGDHISILNSIRTETQNLRHAWQWLVQNKLYEDIRSILAVIILFYEMFGPRQEGSEYLRILLENLPLDHSDEDPTLVAVRALTLAGMHYYSNVDIKQAIKYQEESLDLAEKLPLSSEKAYIYILNITGPGALSTERCIQLCYACVDFFESLDDTWGKALSYLILGDFYNFSRIDSDLAKSSYQTSLFLFTQLNNRWGQGIAFNGLGHLYYQLGEVSEACTMLKQSLEFFEQLGNIDRVLGIRHQLGLFAQQIANYKLARECFEANLTYSVKVGDKTIQAVYQDLLLKLPECNL